MDHPHHIPHPSVLFHHKRGYSNRHTVPPHTMQLPTWISFRTVAKAVVKAAFPIVNPSNLRYVNLYIEGVGKNFDLPQVILHGVSAPP